MSEKILIVEDDADTRAMMGNTVEKMGLAVEDTANGRLALSWLADHPHPAVILLDLMMPEMDGYETARAIRTREQSSDQGSNGKLPVHIIAITANAMQGDREKCLAAGMDDYLSKPIRLQELQAVLKRWKPGTRNRYDQISAARVLAGGPALNTVNLAEETFRVPKTKAAL